MNNLSEIIILMVIDFIYLLTEKFEYEIVCKHKPFLRQFQHQAAVKKLLTSTAFFLGQDSFIHPFHVTDVQW